MRFFSVLCVLVSVCFMSTFNANAETTSTPVPQPKVLFVSIEKYMHVRSLQFVKNDADALRNQLCTRCNCQWAELIDGDETFKGTESPKEMVSQKITQWIASLNEDDIAILYLAGHGLPDENGTLWLPMIDFDTTNFDTAAIPLSWVRETFSNANAKSKLILLDTCYAGTSRDVQYPDSNIDEMSKALSSSQVTTFASSRDNQESWIWSEKQHSLFTYWIIEATKGYADTNYDAEISLDELEHYVTTNVRKVSSSSQEMKKQHPILVNPECAEDSFRLPLKACSRKLVMKELAEQINETLRRNKIKCVMIPEWITGDGSQQTIDAEYGILPRFIANELRSELGCIADDNSYVVLNENATKKLLRDNKVTTENLGSSELSLGNTQVDAILSGRLYRSKSLAATIQIELLIGVRQSEKWNRQVQLSENDLAMLGNYNGVREESVAKPNDQQAGSVMRPDNAGYTNMAEEPIDASSFDQPHPMLNQTLPFTVSLRTRKEGSTSAYQVREGKLIGSNYYIPLQPGEEYEIYIQSKREEETFVRVLVDGLNTLAQHMPMVTKGIGVVPAITNEGEITVAPRVDLSDAASWVIPPFSEQSSNACYSICGFYKPNTSVPQSSSMYRFKITDADDSQAARTGYTEQLGVITVAFYAAIPRGSREAGDSKSEIGTKFGTKEDVTVESYAGENEPGDMIVCYTLRYVSQAKFDKLLKQDNAQ